MHTVSSATKSKKALSLSEKSPITYFVPVISFFGTLFSLWADALVKVDVLQNTSGKPFSSLSIVGVRGTILFYRPV